MTWTTTTTCKCGEIVAYTAALGGVITTSRRCPKCGSMLRFYPPQGSPQLETVISDTERVIDSIGLRSVPMGQPPAEPATRGSAALFRLPASANFNVEQALNAALQDNLTDVMIVGYDEAGVLCIRSSRMTCAEGAFLAEKAFQWAMSGGAS